MTRTPIALLAGLSLGLFAPPPLAQAQTVPAVAASPATIEGFTQRGTHEHGKVVVNLALEGGTLSAELDSPAINVIGFERAPRDAAEKAVVADVDRWLGSGIGVLGVPTAAGCVRGRVDYSPPTLQGEAQTADADHDLDHDHDHDHDHEPGKPGAAAHADYRARFTYTCSNPAALNWVDLWLLRRLKNVQQVEVNLVTAAKQTQLSVTGATPRITLK